MKKKRSLSALLKWLKKFDDRKLSPLDNEAKLQNSVREFNQRFCTGYGQAHDPVNAVTIYRSKNIRVTFKKKVERSRKDSFWFDGQVAVVSNGRKTISIEATGHKELSFFTDDESSYAAEEAVKAARKRKITDKELCKLGDLVVNTNWFDLVEVRGAEYLSMQEVISDLDDAIERATEILEENPTEKRPAVDFSYNEYISKFLLCRKAERPEFGQLLEMSRRVISATGTFFSHKDFDDSKTEVDLWPVFPVGKRRVKPSGPIATFYGKDALKNAIRYQFSLIN